MTPDGLSKLVTILAEEHGVEFTPARLQTWAAVLADVSDDQGVAALYRVLRTSPYPPKVADLVRAIHGTPADQERLLDEEAERAITHLEAHLCDYRINRLGPIVNATIRALGGIDVVTGLMAADRWRFQRTVAMKLARAYLRRGVTVEEGAELVPAVLLSSSYALARYAVEGHPPPVVEQPFQTHRLPALSAGPEGGEIE